MSSRAITQRDVAAFSLPADKVGHAYLGVTQAADLKRVPTFAAAADAAWRFVRYVFSTCVELVTPRVAGWILRCRTRVERNRDR